MVGPGRKQCRALLPMHRKRHILPGFKLSLGFALVYLTVLVLVPLLTLAVKVAQGDWQHALKVVTSAQVAATYKISFGLALVAALFNGVAGLITAWVLVRYEFPGRRILDALVDLPFALPTAVAGIALTTLYSPTGWIGKWLAQLGFKVAFTPWGILLALIFIGFPFVVRTLQPVILGLSDDVEEAAACLGATRLQTFWRVILPSLAPALITGIALAFGRAVGEYGSVVFISGNLPFKTEITPLMIVMKLEQYDYQGAAAIGLLMLVVSLVILVIVGLLQHWNSRRTGHLT